MIRINDHLFRVESIRHIWIETDGDHYVVFIDVIDSGIVPLLAPDRDNAEGILDRIQDEIERYYNDDDMYGDYV